jgi:hypothetical protein
MRHVLVGRSKDKPILQVAYQKGQIVLDDKGLPKLEPVVDSAGKPLQLMSLAEYNQKDSEVLNELKDVMAKHERQVEDANRLTDQIIGDKAKGVRGLWQRILDEREKDADVRAELKLVEPLLINTVVEAQLINKRHQQLVKRIEELRKLKVVSK